MFTKKEAARLKTLSKLGERMLELLEACPEATEAYRALWGPERDKHEVIQTAISRALINRGEDPP